MHFSHLHSTHNTHLNSPKIPQEEFVPHPEQHMHPHERFIIVSATPEHQLTLLGGLRRQTSIMQNTKCKIQNTKCKIQIKNEPSIRTIYQIYIVFKL